MIAARRLQRSFADGLIAEEVQDLWEPWMRHADEALNDDRLLEIIQAELSRRCKKSKTRGRPSTSAEVVLWMLLLKNMRGWSYEDVTRSARSPGIQRVHRRGRRQGPRQDHGGWHVSWVRRRLTSCIGVRWDKQCRGGP